MSWEQYLDKLRKEKGDPAPAPEKVEADEYENALNWDPAKASDYGVIPPAADYSWAKMFAEEDEMLDGKYVDRALQFSGSVQEGLKSIFDVPLALGGYEMPRDKVRDALLKHPQLLRDPAAASSILQQGDALKRTLEKRGLKFREDIDPFTLGKEAVAHLRSVLPGRFIGRLPKAAEGRLVQAAMIHHAVINSDLEGGYDLPGVTKKVREAVSPGLRVPYEGTDQEFQQDFEAMDTVLDAMETVTYPDPTPWATSNVAFYDNKDTMLRWYTHLTGAKPPEGITLDNLMGPIKAYVANFKQFRDKAIGAEKWARAGYNLPLNRIRDRNGRVTEATLPGAEEDVAKFLINHSKGMAYDNIYEHANDYAMEVVKDMVGDGRPVEYFTNQLEGVEDETKSEIVKYLDGVKGSSARWRAVRLAAIRNPQLQAALSRIKHKNRTDYVTSNSQKLKEDGLAQGIPVETMTKFIEGQHQRQSLLEAQAKRRADTPFVKYGISYIQSVISGLGAMVSAVPGVKESAEAMRPVWKAVRAAEYGWIPADERAAVGVGGDKDALQVLREGVGKLFPVMNMSQDDLVNKYADSVAMGENIPVWSEVSLMASQFTRGLMELPFMAAENPAGFAVFTKALGAWQRGTIKGGAALSRATNMPWIDRVAGFMARPHDPFLNMLKASGASDYLMMAATTHGVRKYFNGMPAPVRDKYIKMLNDFDNTISKYGSKATKEITSTEISGISKFAAELGSMLGRANKEYKLSTKDMRHLANLARANNVPYEAANVMMGGPMGTSRLYDGAISHIVDKGESRWWANFEDDIKYGRNPMAREKSLITSLIDIDNAYDLYKNTRIEERAQVVKDMLGNKKYSDKAIDWAVNNLFKSKDRLPEENIFDPVAVQTAVKDNLRLVQDLHGRRGMLEGVYESARLQLDSDIKHVRDLAALLKGANRRKMKPEMLKKMEADLAARQKGAQTMQQMVTRLDRDIRSMKQMEQSAIIPSYRKRTEDPMATSIEDGWRSSMGKAERDMAFNTLIRQAQRDPELASRLLGMVDQTDQGKFSTIKEALTGKLANRTLDKAREALRGSGLAPRLFSMSPKPNVKTRVGLHKQHFRQVFAALENSYMNNQGKELASSIAGLLGAAYKDRSRFFPSTARRTRLMGQRVDSLSQGMMSKLVQLADRQDELSKEQVSHLSRVIRQSRENLDFINDATVRDLAIDMFGVRDEILESAYRLGRLSRREVKDLKATGFRPRFYLQNQFRRDLGKLKSRDVENIIGVPDDASDFRHLHTQRKRHTTRVRWADRAEGQWKVEDFGPSQGYDIKTGYKAAKKYVEELKKKGVQSRDIQGIIEPLSDADIASMGLIKNDASYQLGALQNMVADLAQARYINEVGMIRGLVRDSLKDIPLDRRGEYYFIGDGVSKYTPDSMKRLEYQKLPVGQRRELATKWGGLAGRYVHTSFFDSINHLGDYVSTIGRVADAFKDAIKESKAEVDGLPTKLWNSIKSGNAWLNTTLRKTLITHNAVAFFNNNNTAITSSHMAGANITDPGFWGAVRSFGRNFSRLDNDKFLKTPEGQLFLYGAKHGLFERTDESTAAGGRIHLTAKKQTQIGNISYNKWVDEVMRRSAHRVKRRRHEIDEISKTLDEIYTMLDDPKVTGKTAAKLRERAEIYRQIRRDKRGEIQKETAKDLHDAAVKWPAKKAARWAKKARVAAGDAARGLYTRRGGVLSDAIGEAYGTIDPMYKWATLKNLVDQGYTKEAALQMVLDVHQNYSMVGPRIHQLKKIPILGAFVPSFAAESVRTLRNAFRHSPARAISPLLAPAIWNQSIMATQGMDPSDLANMYGTEDMFDLFKATCCNVMFPDGDGGMYTMATHNFSVYAPFFEEKGILRRAVDNMGGDAAFLKPFMNLAGNFAGSTPGGDLMSKFAFGVDQFSGEVMYRKGDMTSLLTNMAKETGALLAPRALTTLVEQYKRVSTTPRSTITKRNVTAVEGALRTFGLKIQRKRPAEARAELALRYLYKDARESFIKDHITRAPEFMRDISLLSSMKFGTDEYKTLFTRLRDEEMRNKGGELTIGSRTFDDMSEGTKKEKAAKTIVRLASQDIFSVIEAIPLARRPQYARALFSSGWKDSKEYKHTITALTDEKIINRAGDIGSMSDAYASMVQMAQATTDPTFKNHMVTGAQAVIRAAIKRVAASSTKEPLIDALLSATKGSIKYKLNLIFARKIGLLR